MKRHGAGGGTKPRVRSFTSDSIRCLHEKLQSVSHLVRPSAEDGRTDACASRRDDRRWGGNLPGAVEPGRVAQCQFRDDRHLDQCRAPAGGAACDHAARGSGGQELRGADLALSRSTVPDIHRCAGIATLHAETRPGLTTNFVTGCTGPKRRTNANQPDAGTGYNRLRGSWRQSRTRLGRGNRDNERKRGAVTGACARHRATRASRPAAYRPGIRLCARAHPSRTPIIKTSEATSATSRAQTVAAPGSAQAATRAVAGAP